MPLAGFIAARHRQFRFGAHQHPPPYGQISGNIWPDRAVITEPRAPELPPAFGQFTIVVPLIAFCGDNGPIPFI